MKRLTMLGLVLALLFASSAHATFTSYDNETAFQAAIAGMTSQTLDFDSLSAPLTINSGDIIDGVTFTYSIPGYSIIVDNQFDTTSLNNYLGTDDDTIYAFLGGDSFTMGFDQSLLAVGLYIISADVIFDGDVTLTTNSGGVADLTANVDHFLSDGEAYFLGMVTDDPLEAFDSVTLNSFPADFAFNVDDVISAVPEPSTYLLFATGLLALFVTGRRRFSR